MRVAITGSSGFIGTHLSSLLESKSLQVLRLHSNITSFKEVYDEFSQLEFDSLIHLAGMSHPPACEENPEEAYKVNTSGTFHILESLLRLNRKTRFIFASTGQVYASPSAHQDEIIIDESWPVIPRNAYARTKLAAEQLVSDYFHNYDLGSAISFRLFNHSHSSQSGDFILPILYREMQNHIDSEKTYPLKLKVGNIDVYRDFGAISDLCHLFFKATNPNKKTEKYSIFNACSGHKRFIRTLANEMANQMGLECDYELDPQKIRKNEPHVVVGSCNKASQTFDWSPLPLNDAEYIKMFLLKNI